MTTAVKRIFNFSAGPAVLPLPVLEEVQRDLLALPGVGMSILEISHRSKPFDAIHARCIDDLRALLRIPTNYRILFLQGGASLQFSMIPMNFMKPAGKADYIVTGVWSKKAVKEAKRVGTVQIAATTEADRFSRIPVQSELVLDPGADYVHFTSNNTIYGTEWAVEPQVGNVPLICDASSDIMSRPLDISKYAAIYAGAQKNIGPSGVTLVILREDLLDRCDPALATMLNYKTHADASSLYNTPSVFGIYMIGLVAKYLRENGGIEAMQQLNERKARLLYDAIDQSTFYRGTAQKDSRSLMNVTFRLPDEALEKRFVTEATAAGFDGLKGHRDVGGLRASIYNAFPIEGVEALLTFMRDFEHRA